MPSLFRNILFILATFVALSAKAQTAGFTASPTSGCAPLVVSFTNTSTTGATGYYWDFGDGFHSTLPSPSTSYLTPGTYTVTLTVTYPGGVTRTSTTTIIVYPPPTVSFTVSDTAVCPGTPISYTSTTIGGVPGPITYTWSFGDGYTSTLSNPSHTYGAPGYYNITLTATNSSGCVATLSLFAYIHIYTPPIPTFSAATTSFCHPPGHAVFTGAAFGAAPFTYSWRFGDGGTGSGSSPTHDYSTTGSYNVTMIVTDANGCTDSITRSSYITVTDSHASFTGPHVLCAGSTATFINTSSSHTTTRWDFGDGSWSAFDPGVHTYGTPGRYTVRLIVGTPPCADTAFDTIRVLPPPVISFTITPTDPCPAPATITYTGTAPAGSVVSWTYSDGGSGSGSTTSHTFGTNMVYTVTMTVVDPATGCTANLSKTDTIYDLHLNILAPPYQGCKPLTINFSAYPYTYAPYTSGTALYPFPLTGYSWNFGDGSGTSTGATPTHVYTAVGTYFAVLTGITANGCTVTDSVKIKVGAPPVVTFSASPTHQCYRNNDVNFTSTIIVGPVDSFYWQFGDGSMGFTFTGFTHHHYTLPGVFTVTVIPVYNGCPGIPVVISDTIRIDSPMAVLTDFVYCSPANRVQFRDVSFGDDSREWLFGDGFTSTIDNPVHDYATAGVYLVTLATYNSRSGCRDTAQTSIDLRRPVINFTSIPAICRDGVVIFTSTVTGGSASGYHWSAWSGTFTGTVLNLYDSTSPVFVDTFHHTGIYNVRLIIRDVNGCFDTLLRNSYLTVAKPVASFTALPTSGCWPLTVLFTDASTDVAGTSFTNFVWAFGDGGTSAVTIPTVTHTFTTAATFSTQEIVTDNIGCKDTVTLPLVTVYRPTAAFTPSTTYPCKFDIVTFTNTSVASSGTIVSSYWWFGDGTTSTLTSPTHIYTATGAYTIKLAVTDSRGCVDTLIMPTYINVTAPVAQFTMSDSFSICPPLLVYFTNTSTGGIIYNWAFGDGSYSTSPNPSDLYTTTGYDTVSLIVTNRFGCKDTAYGHVSIFGYAGGFSYAPISGCSPLTVKFKATISNVATIIWDFSDGSISTVSLVDSISHVYTIPGAYVPKLILSDNTGCQNSSLGIDTIKVDGVTPGFKVLPDPICLNGTANFTDISTSYWSSITNWHWTFNNGDTSIISNPSYTYSVVGTFPVALTVTDGWGCVGSVSTDLVIYPPPVIIASPDTIICLTDKATLSATGGVSYTWTPAGTLSCADCNPTYAGPDAITTYTVTGKDVHGCLNSDTVTVYLKYKTVSRAWGDTDICKGVTVPLHDTGGTKYTWIPGTGLNNPNLGNPTATPTSTTSYMGIAKLAGCIADTNYVRIVVYPLPSVDAGPDQTLVEGSTAELHATGTLIYSYAWRNANTLSCDSCADPIASMSVTTTYHVDVATNHGCRATDTVTIHIFCDKSQLFVPNAFTPNGDGQNDIFYPRGIGVSNIKSFRIYNRWGEVLFERSNIQINDANNAWDGSYKGSAPKPDVYVYIIDAICETGEPINIKGDVTIIR